MDRFNEVKLVAGERPTTFTQLNRPDAAAYDAYLEETGRRRITYDDGLAVQNFNIANLDGFGPVYSTATSPRMGDTVTGLTGVLSYKWAGNSASGATWRVHTNGQNPVVFEKTNPRPATVPSKSDDEDEDIVKIVTLNSLNFFTTLDVRGNPGSGPDADRPRGADNSAEFDRQATKFVNALAIMDADIYSLQEVENEYLMDVNGDGVFAIGFIVEALSTATGKSYAYVEPPSIYVGPQAISNAIIYDMDRAELVGTPDVFLDQLGDFNRAAITASFRFKEPQEEERALRGRKLSKKNKKNKPEKCITLSSNHFKSKGSSCASVGDPDPSPDNGTGNCNGTRKTFALDLIEHLKTTPTGINCKYVAISGDLNSYASEDPIVAIEDSGFTNSLEKSDYNYIFDGFTGTLDYFFINDSKALKFSAPWHINEDEPDALDYNLDFGKLASYFDGSSPARHSDHSPLITYLKGLVDDDDDDEDSEDEDIFD